MIWPSESQLKKENMLNTGLCRSGRLQSKIKRKWKKRWLSKPSKSTKKLWNMKDMVKPIVIGPLGTIPKGLVKGLEDLEIRGQVETIQTTAGLRSARILKRVLKTWGTCCHSNSSEKPSAYTGVKNSQTEWNDKYSGDSL